MGRPMVKCFFSVISFFPFFLTGWLGECGGIKVRKGDHVISNPFASETQKPEKKKGIVVRRSVGLNSVEITLPEENENTLVQYPLAELRGEPVSRAALAEAKEKKGDEVSADMSRDAVVPISKEAYIRRSYLMGIAKVKERYRKKEYELALVDLDPLLEVFPNDMKLLSLRGTIASKLGLVDIAEDSWMRALRLDPANASIRNSLGQIQRSKQAKK